MKNIILLFLFLIPAFLFAQYPATGNKSRLGYQTTGDGLIWRGVAADTLIKPRTTANAYFQLDTVNRILRRYIATQGKWQAVAITPDLSPYLLIADTAAMLTNYPSTAGYGIIDAGKTWRADTTSPNGLATRLFAKTLPTSITNTRIAVSNGSNLVGHEGYTWSNSTRILGLGNPTSAVGSGNTVAEIRFNNSSSHAGKFRITQPSSFSNDMTWEFIPQGLSGTSAMTITSGGTSSIAALVPLVFSSNTNYMSLAHSGGTNEGFRFDATTSKRLRLNGFYLSLEGNTGEIFQATDGTNVKLRMPGSGNLLLGTTTDVATSILTARSTTKSSSPFPLHTLAESDAITGVQGNFDYETTQNGLRGHNGTRKFYVPESTVARFTTTYVPHADANGQLTQSANFLFNSSNTLQLTNAGANNVSHITMVNTSFSNSMRLRSVANTPYAGNFRGLSMDNVGGFMFNESTPAVIVHGGSLGNVLIQGGLGSNTGIQATFRGTLHNGTSNNGHIEFKSNHVINNGAVAGNSRTITLIPSLIYSATAGVTHTSLYYAPLLTAMNNVTHRFIETVTGDWYVGSTSGVMGIRTAPDPYYGLKLNEDLYVMDSTRLTTTPAHSAITGLLTRDATGWVGLGTLGSGLSYSGGVLTATGASTWLKPELEAGRDVDITGGTSTDLRFRSNTRMQIDGKFKIGSDSSFVHDPAQDTTFYKGNIKQNGNIYTQAGTNAGRDFPNIFYLKSDAAYNVAGTSYANPGTGKFNWYILNDQRNYGEDGFGIKNENLHYAPGIPSYNTLFTIRNNGNLELGYPYNSHYSRVNSDTFMVSPTYTASPQSSISGAPFYVIGHPLYAKTVSNSKFYVGQDSTLKFDPANDLLQLSEYDGGAKTATALSKTFSTLAGFATDGTVLNVEQKRDTTIHIDDADYDWSAAITTAQIARRFNRVIFWMTTTGAAGSDSELTLHTPDVNLMQVEYLIHSVDEAGGFSNVIRFGSNNAVDSTNGLVSSYFPAAGDGIHIRAGLRSSVYKYRYSN